MHTLPQSWGNQAHWLSITLCVHVLPAKYLAGCLIPCQQFSILVLSDHDTLWRAVTSMLTFIPTLGNYSFFWAWRDECPFVNLVMSDSFCQNVIVSGETAVEQSRICFLDCCGREKNACEFESYVSDVTKERCECLSIDIHPNNLPSLYVW